MLDIKWIRRNPEELDEMLVKRGAEPVADAIIALDERCRSLGQKLQDMQYRRNTVSKEIGIAVAKGNVARAETLRVEIGDLKGLLPQIDRESRKSADDLADALARIPNHSLNDVPVGKDDSDNVVLRVFGEKPQWSHPSKQHFEIGEELGYMDFESAAKLSGSRFTVLTGPFAKLERALGQFMIDLHTTEHGYTEVSSPLLVRESAVFGAGQLPKFESDLFKTLDGRWLIPTAEVTLTNLVAGEIVSHEALPLRFTALTPSFRSEAGAAGRDTRGMLRQHQFWKCELVSITDEENSLSEHERMTACAEEVLKRLGLHFRTVTLCTGDMGFSAKKTYDLDVWLPGQKAYREVSSCSSCGDFQARRMNARYRAREGRETKFVHTLNGSGIAVGRALIAVLENYLNEDGSITIPDALVPYMGGARKIEAVK